MKAIFGIVSLLLALAVVGVLASRQLKTVGQAAVPGDAASSPGAATVREQSQQLQEKVRGDVVRALEQGARKEEPGQ